MEKRFRLSPETRKDQPENEGNRRIIPPFSPEPVDLGYYRIMSLKEAENHDPGHGHAQQDKRGVPVSDQPEDQIEKQIKNRNFYNKPPVAVNQRDSADVQDVLALSK